MFQIGNCAKSGVEGPSERSTSFIRFSLKWLIPAWMWHNMLLQKPNIKKATWKYFVENFRVDFKEFSTWLSIKPMCLCAQLFQSCPTICNPMDYSLPGSSVHGIFQARILEWVAITSSRGSSQPRYWIQVSCIAGSVCNAGEPGSIPGREDPLEKGQAAHSSIPGLPLWFSW